MAVSTTGSSVVFTSGRGRNATVSLSISFREIDRWAARNRVDTARLMRRSFGRAVGGLRKKFASVMQAGGGTAGVPKFADFEAFTQELRAKRGTSGRQMGGVLAEKNRIVAFKRNGWQYIGWPDRLGAWAVKFQDAVGPEGYNPFTDPAGRAAFHRLGIADVPHAYVHKPRRVIPEPFGSYVKANLKEWARSIFYKDLARQMKKTGGIK